jgi:Asp/Glu/hydantoin racemase
LSEKDEYTITLDDVEMAIKILEIFLARYEKAVRLTRRLRVLTGSASSRMRLEDMLMNMALQQALGKTAEAQAIPSETLQEMPQDEYVDMEAVRRLREKARKIAEKEAKK